MTFLGVLAVTFLAALLLPVRLGGRSVKTAGRRAMGMAFVVAGMTHFLMPESFLAYFPSWVPYPELLNYGTGIAEIAGGIALLTPWDRVRWVAGVLLAVYLVLVLPANAYVAISNVDVPGLPDVWWYAWARLPFQALFIWWVLRSTSPESEEDARVPFVSRLRPAPVQRASASS